MKKMTLVKWDYESLPEDWRISNPNIYENLTFIYLGKVRKMRGHSYVQDIKTGKPYILHTNELKKLTKEEI